MRAVVLAYHDMGCAGLRNVIEAGYDVVAVFTHADDPEETGWFESVDELAARR
jgi:UDP-4-amino-4-deoxy-L-arabinose formyltransferase/UDP-glucuronic acid dehydrogenase (UDP-4-keto-hexauronic acid decarboxylating)